MIKEKEQLLFDHTIWLMTAMDVTAEHLHGEFGYDTCSRKEKQEVLREMTVSYTHLTLPTTPYV